MANERVSDLPTVPNATLADTIYAIQGGVSVKETLQQVFSLIFENIILTNNGDPNNVVAGTKGQLLFDTANDYFWICKTTGTSSTAVWVTSFGVMSDGEIIIGATGGIPQVATLTPGPGINIVNGAGTITLSATGTSFPWTEVTGTTQAMSANNGYVANNASQIDFSLPASAAIGDVLKLAGKGAGGWRISQAAGQQIHIGQNSSTVGATGYVESTGNRDSLELVCTTANTEWSVFGGPQGSLTTN